ncbi:LOG family protein [Curtobacterium ammoniigenes]|uniref:LOG family protein n=1 Tax=Curtobacterium ammoniigenes TaxID=395387 RepID=UPI00082F2452|nr:TIGR00730 family Rossman fold protein [Curtobacterium ammoniigenes]
MRVTSVAVFCGSSDGSDARYADAARRLGAALGSRGIRVVYGGGTVGLMGAVADAALAAGGSVVGVMPRTLADREVEHRGLTEFHVVPDMHRRKAMMADLADAFIALPGGIGTLEEIAEQWTWSQLGIHDKPCAFLDELGYWTPLRDMVTTMVAQGFLRPDVADRVRFASTLDEVLAFFAAF